MSARTVDTSDPIPGQDATHRRIHDLLGAVTAALLEAQPGLRGFEDHRPERDRSSGNSWRGQQTLCHVSALLAGSARPELTADGAQHLIGAVHAVAAARGLQRRSDQAGHGISGATWRGEDGDLLEVIVGVRVAVRAISAPFLPGSRAPMATTGPASPLSPLTLPPRRVR